MAIRLNVISSATSDCPVHCQDVFQRRVGLDIVAGANDKPTVGAYFIHQVIDLVLNLLNTRPLQPSLHVNRTVQGDLAGEFLFQLVRIHAHGLRLDGFTTCLRRPVENTVNPSDEFTVEGWVALGNYPWNWCPILTTESDEIKGYRLMLGPHGQVSLQGAMGEQWISCTNEQEVMPLRQWMHIVGVYRAAKSLELYLNGKLIASSPVQGKIAYALRPEFLIGMAAASGNNH